MWREIRFDIFGCFRKQLELFSGDVCLIDLLASVNRLLLGFDKINKINLYSWCIEINCLNFNHQ